MSHHHNCYCPPVGPIYDPPRQVIRNFYHPQLVQVIQPIEIVNRHHCVPVYQHCVQYTERDEVVGPGGYPGGFRNSPGRAQISQARSKR